MSDNIVRLPDDERRVVAEISSGQFKSLRQRVSAHDALAGEISELEQELNRKRLLLAILQSEAKAYTNALIAEHVPDAPAGHLYQVDQLSGEIRLVATTSEEKSD